MLEKVIYFDGSPKGWTCVDREDPNHPGSRDQHYTTNKLLLAGLDLPEDFVTPTSNQRAEYLGLIRALQLITTYEPHLVIGDCENVILQMQGINRVRDKALKTLYDKAIEIIKVRGLNVEFGHVPRDDNLAGVFLEKYLSGRR